MTGVNDDIDNPDDKREVTFTLNPSGTGTKYDALANVTGKGKVTDDDAISLVLSETSLSVDENGGTGAFTVKLGSIPSASVTVAVSSGATGNATVSPASLTFTDSNWSTTQTVTVTGVDDGVANSPSRTATITLNPSSSDTKYNALANSTVTATALDDEFVMPTDPCVYFLSGANNGKVRATLTDECSSVSRPGHYAAWYVFTLPQDADIEVAMSGIHGSSGLQPDIRLWDNVSVTRSGHLNRGRVIASTNFRPAANIAAIVMKLSAGSYVMEAPTAAAGATGGYVADIAPYNAVSAQPQLPIVEEACEANITPGTINGNWASGCESTHRTGPYARYYTFTLSEAQDVTINLNSSVDTRLVLREGHGKNGRVNAENDDISATNQNSRISQRLAAGRYTIEATIYDAGVTGSFTLTLAAAAGTQCQFEIKTGTTNGSWVSGCASTYRTGPYARYYTFTLSEAQDVTISLSSSADPYLALREGHGKNGRVNAENDDISRTDRPCPKSPLCFRTPSSAY